MLVIAVDVPCPLRILYIVNRAKTQSTSLTSHPLESHESHLPIVAYDFAYSGQNKSLKVAQIDRHYIPIPYVWHLASHFEDRRNDEVKSRSRKCDHIHVMSQKCRKSSQ